MPLRHASQIVQHVRDEVTSAEKNASQALHPDYNCDQLQTL